MPGGGEHEVARDDDVARTLGGQLGLAATARVALAARAEAFRDGGGAASGPPAPAPLRTVPAMA